MSATIEIIDLGLEAATKLSNEIFDSVADMEIPNEGPYNEDGIIGGDYVFFSELKTPILAAGNCYNASEHIADFMDMEELEIDDIQGPAGNHCFLRMGNYVIDFTFRQFDADSEFPLVMEIDDFLEKLAPYLDGDLDPDYESESNYDSR